jgi:hypothetical protein
MREAYRLLSLVRQEFEAAALEEPWGSEFLQTIASDLARVQFLIARDELAFRRRAMANVIMRS